jgi:flagellar hook-length control protein FliK
LLLMVKSQVTGRMMEAINIANAIASPNAAAATGADKTTGGDSGAAAGFGSLLTQQIKQVLGQDHIPGLALGAGDAALMDLLKAGVAATPDASAGELVSDAASAKGVDVDLLQRISALMQGSATPSDALKKILNDAQALTAGSDAQAGPDEAENGLQPSVGLVGVSPSTLLRAIGKKDDVAEKDGKKLPVDAGAQPDSQVDTAALAAMVGAQIVPQVQKPVPQVGTGEDKNLVDDRRPVVLDGVLNKAASSPPIQVSVYTPSKSVPEISTVEPQANPQTFSALMADRAATSANQMPVATLEVPQRVDSPSWGAAVGDKVVWMVGNQNQSAELRLNPPSLGPLEVHVSMNDGQATLSFMTSHGAVREAIEAATPRLREMLGESGISLGGVSVNVGTFTQQQQPPQDQAQQKSSPGYWQGSVNELESGGYAASVVTSVSYLRDGGTVDLFA